MGAASPGRWQPWQFFARIGATSLVKVTWGGLVAAVAVRQKTIPGASSRRIESPLLILYAGIRQKDWRILAGFAADQIFVSLAPPDHAKLVALHQDLRRTDA